MHTEKDFYIINEFNYKNKKYYALMSDDYDSFFMGDKDGKIDYITIEEYMELEKVFSKRAVLHYPKEYTTTYINNKPKKDSLLKRIHTSKLVWKGKTLIPVILAIALSVGIPVNNIVQKYYFDKNITANECQNYGLDLSYLDSSIRVSNNIGEISGALDIVDGFSVNIDNMDDELRNKYLATIDFSIINKVDSKYFPSNSDIINKDELHNDYTVVTRDEFCNAHNITSVSLDQVIAAIDNLYINDNIKELFKEGIKKILEVEPDYDMRILYYNLTHLNIRNETNPDLETIIDNFNHTTDNDFEFDPMNNEFYIPKRIYFSDSKKLSVAIHELYHLNNNSYNKENGYRFTTFQDCLMIHSKEQSRILKSCGIALEESKANDFEKHILKTKSKDDGITFYIDTIYYLLKNLYNTNEIPDLNFSTLINTIINSSKSMPSGITDRIYDLDCLYGNAILYNYDYIDLSIYNNVYYSILDTYLAYSTDDSQTKISKLNDFLEELREKYELSEELDYEYSMDIKNAIDEIKGQSVLKQ